LSIPQYLKTANFDGALNAQTGWNFLDFLNFADFLAKKWRLDGEEKLFDYKLFNHGDRYANK
jgi:hypothetical protein